MKKNPEPFKLFDCALITLATGFRAINLRELAMGIRDAEQGSIYHHFWGRLLQPQFDEPEYNNDFASWAHRDLHDKTVAERLSMIDPSELDSIEDLREELIEIIEMRMDETESAQYAIADSQFHFLRSQMIVIPTGRQVKQPEGLQDALRDASAGCIFYHFIDSRRRTESHHDDFTNWLAGFGDEYEVLCGLFSNIDPYFSSLQHVRDMLVEACEAGLKAVANGTA